MHVAGFKFVALSCLSCLIFPVSALAEPGKPAQQLKFLIPPTVQLGASGSESNLCVEFAPFASSKPLLEYRQSQEPYRAASLKQLPLYASLPGKQLFVAELSGLKPSLAVEYKIREAAGILFQGQIKPRPARDEQAKFALVGSVAYGGKLASLLSQIQGADPSAILFTGDLLKPLSSSNAYIKQFFHEFSGKNKLCSSAVSVLCPGDRELSADRFDPDNDNRNLDQTPGNLAYFAFWQQPLNGPAAYSSNDSNFPQVKGAAENIAAFCKAAAQNYPLESNFSFDWGDTHWLVLDGGKYVDLNRKDWRSWVAADLSRSKKTWKFVLMHQSGFSSDPVHGEEQQMRRLCDLFEANGVDMVFSGHSNSYQRTAPLRFTIQSEAVSDPESNLGYVYGKVKSDKKFDGVSEKHPDGIIYIISGAGGLEPASQKIQADTTRWQPYTRKFYSEKNSFTVLSVKGKNLELKQVTDDGAEIDKITVEK